VTVIDASVAVKWFVQEKDSDLAKKFLEEQQGYLQIPDVFVVEVSSVLVRNANINKVDHDIFRTGLYHLIDLIDRQSIVLNRTPPGIVVDAGHIAIDLGHPLKDCIYLALAMELGCELVTCDARFAAKAKGVWAGVRVLGD
jgi:predicted nucleic acid-binding protein